MSEVDARGTLDRDAVIALAGDLLDRHGAENFTLSKVAEAADVTLPALYRHVDNVADLWRGLGLATRRELAERLASSIRGRSGLDAVEAVAFAWRDYAMTHPGRYRSTERHPVLGDPELVDAVDRVVELLAASLRGFELDDDERTDRALILRSALHGFMVFQLDGGNPHPERTDQTFDRLVDVTTSGLTLRS